MIVQEMQEVDSHIISQYQDKSTTSNFSINLLMYVVRQEFLKKDPQYSLQT